MQTAVITTGGLGTRLLTCTKGSPKTMLPIYNSSIDNFPDPILKPLIEFIFENLYDHGFRRFCFIVGKKTKSIIINHILPDSKYIELLKKRNLPEDKRFIKTLMRLYTKILNSEIKWISQENPLGFGDALLRAKNFVGKETFLLHAGDVYFPNYQFLDDFIRNHNQIPNTTGSVLLKRMKSVKGYGIAQIMKQGGTNIITQVAEKPKRPISNLAILPLYIFNPHIFHALKKTEKGNNNELQITDAIMTLINWNKRIIAFNYGNKPWFDIGTPHNYFRSLKFSYLKSVNKS